MGETGLRVERVRWEDMEYLVGALAASTDEHGPHHPQTLAAAHRLAVGFWSNGDTQSAIGLLDQILKTITNEAAPLDVIGVDALNTLGKILFQERHLEQACAIHREVLEFHLDRNGPTHPDALAAQGDLATVLFELGDTRDADALEQDAFSRAQQHLTGRHPVRSVLAWHVALTCQRNGNAEGFKRALAEELLWLLAEEPKNLEPDQRAIRMLLEERLQWNTASRC